MAGKRAPVVKRADVDEAFVDALWDVDDVIKFLKSNAKGSSKYQTIYKLNVPRIRIGGMVRFIPSEVQAWASKQKGD